MIPISTKVLDNLSDPVFVNSHDGIYTACNKAFEDLIDIPKCRIIGKTIHEVWPRDLANLYLQADIELRQKKRGEQKLNSYVKSSKKGKVICGVYYKTLINCDFYGHKDAVLGVFKAQKDHKKVIKHTNALLSIREIDILTLASRGLSNKLISERLGISHHTVADYFKSIHAKLDVHNRIEAIALAREFNLIYSRPNWY